MLCSKFYFLLGLLFIFVSCSLSVDQKPRKSGESVSDGKRKPVESGNDDIRRKEKVVNDDDYDDEVDDHLIAALSFADNRYSPFSPPEGNYRTQARWPQVQPPSVAAVPSPFNDLMNANDWSRWDFSNLFSSPVPSPSVPYDTNPTLAAPSASCSSVVDSQYPIFSDVCGAVPQARYSLPNALGHRERWQVAQTLSALLSSTSDAACTRSVRLLLCPVLFPPCPSRHEPPAVLPCQSYCRAVKARCAIPTLDLLPCEVLPLSSDLCPTNQAYGSFVPPVSQPSPVNNALPTSNFPVPRPYPSLQSLLSSQGLQSVAQPTANPNLFNSNPFGSDSLSPLLVDFPSRSYNDFRQAQNYPPLTRSATDVRSKAETKYPTSQRSSAVPSQVLA